MATVAFGIILDHKDGEGIKTILNLVAKPGWSMDDETQSANFVLQDDIIQENTHGNTIELDGWNHFKSVVMPLYHHKDYPYIKFGPTIWGDNKNMMYIAEGISYDDKDDVSGFPTISDGELLIFLKLKQKFVKEGRLPKDAAMQCIAQCNHKY